MGNSGSMNKNDTYLKMQETIQRFAQKNYENIKNKIK